MTRTLVLIRHAKSSWANPLQSDFERPLNDRGEHDAPMMGERLKKMNVIPHLIVSSSAKRAKQTAKKIADAMDYDKDKIKFVESLYHCIPSVFEEVIYELDDTVNTVFIVAHNPGITDFANEMSEFKTDNMPTCGMVGVQVEAESWTDFSMGSKKVFLYEYPKKQYDIK